MTAITEGVGGGLSRRSTGVIVGSIVGTSLRGPLLFSAVAGSLPVGADQVGLGVSTMRQVGGGIGSIVDITFTTQFRCPPHRAVPGRLPDLLPAVGGFVSLGTGILTDDGRPHPRRLSRGSPARPVPTGVRCAQLRHRWGQGELRPGPAREGGAGPLPGGSIHQLRSQPLAPTSLVNFGEAVNFPLIFGAMLAVFGAATLAHLLVVSVSRRRREVGLLKVLGFVNRQVVSTVCLAGHHPGPGRRRRRCPAGAGRRPGGLEHLRQQSRGRPGRRRAVAAHRGHHGRGPRRRQRHRDRSGVGGGTIEAGGPPATTRLNAL